MKGVLLAGGSGSRLDPLTRVVCKQLLPVFDKPMIYYPLSVLMLAGVRDIAVVCSRESMPLLQRLLGDGGHLGIRLTYALQPSPRGVADALLVAAPFLDGSSAALVLGDNIFYGAGLPSTLRRAAASVTGAVLFAYRVQRPERYGVVELDADGRPLSLEEKPAHPRSAFAVPGLYFYDGRAPELASLLAPSARQELEITDLNRLYVEEGSAKVHVLGRGMVWLDAGEPDSLLEASQFVAAVQHRQGGYIACIEEVAARMGFIGSSEFARLAAAAAPNEYGAYLRFLAQGELAADALEEPTP